MTHTVNEVEQWFGQKLVGGDGSSIGTIKDVYLDDATNQPERSPSAPARSAA